MRATELLDRLLGRSPAHDEAELGRMLEEAGLSGAPMVTNPDSSQDQAAMLAHLGVDAAAVPAAYRGALRDAERVCACCLTVARCHAWLAAERTNDSPRLFCPNARLLDEIAQAQRKAQGGA
jgi:hypothetical protein